uniref:Uncharacterized protein n=1 Tax=Lygus hesperus TaxID=30085 RepID=A0A0A9WBG8_LYGHE
MREERVSQMSQREQLLMTLLQQQPSHEPRLISSNATAVNAVPVGLSTPPGAPMAAAYPLFIPSFFPPSPSETLSHATHLSSPSLAQTLPGVTARKNYPMELDQHDKVMQDKISSVPVMPDLAAAQEYNTTCAR